MDLGSVLSRQAVAITASLLVSFVAVLLTTGLLGRWLLPAEPEVLGNSSQNTENHADLADAEEAGR
jgi:putative effector of murein hydrolase LrgA (UPF0299 family)